MTRKDYHRILGVSKDADEKELKRAFRRLALQYHPDRNSSPQAEERFKEISEAYAVLSGKEKAPETRNWKQETGNRGRGAGNRMQEREETEQEREERLWAYRVMATWQKMEGERHNNMYR